MSSFPAGSIASSLNFDTSAWTGGFAEVISKATSFPEFVGSNLDAPMAGLGPIMAQAAASIAASSEQAKSSIAAIGPVVVGVAGDMQKLESTAQIKGVVALDTSHAMSSAASLAPVLRNLKNAATIDGMVRLDDGQFHAKAMLAEAQARDLARHARIAGEATMDAEPFINETKRALAEVRKLQAAANVRGTADMNSKPFMKGMAAMQAAMQLFPPLVIELITNPLLGAVAVATELTHKIADVFGHAVSDVGRKAGEIALAAQKAGVSPEFFSKWEEAGRTVNVSAEQIGTGFKMMQRTAVDAINGVGEAQKAFGNLGISTEYLSKHLDNMEGVWTRVHERLETIPTAAEKTRIAMEVMGRSGSELTPLLTMATKQFDALVETAKKAGSLENGGTAEMGKKFLQMTTQMHQMWEGLQKKIAEPILMSLAEHWDDIQPRLQKIADILGDLIPKALEKMRDAVTGLLIPAVDGMLAVLQKVLHVTDKLGLTDNAEKDVAESREGLEEVKIVLNDIKFTIDPNKAATEVARQVTPHIQEASRQMANRMDGAQMGAEVAHAMGGRHG